MDKETEDEIRALAEESWYWSTINDIVQAICLYGKDKVDVDISNALINMMSNNDKGIDL